MSQIREIQDNLWRVSIWLDKWWWKILLAPPADKESRWPLVDWFKSAKCRTQNHPAGIIYYNPSGWEPDYHCKNCYDKLG